MALDPKRGLGDHLGYPLGGLTLAGGVLDGGLILRCKVKQVDEGAVGGGLGGPQLPVDVLQVGLAVFLQERISNDSGWSCFSRWYQSKSKSRCRCESCRRPE